MKIVRHTDANFSQKLREVTAPSSLFDPGIEQRTRAIIDAVQMRGDDALLEFTEKFDGARLTANQLAVTQAELMVASLKADESLRAAVAEAEKNIATFARKSLLRNWECRNSHGARVGEKFDPFQPVRSRSSSNAPAPSSTPFKSRGDDALLEFTEKFDGAKLAADQLAVTQAELFNASLAADESLRAAVAEAEKNIAAFARKSLRKNWQMKNSHGASVGEKFDPFQRVGVYIPGGTAPLVSTALMTITLAKVAGCPEIVVCTPCGRDGSINPALLFAARAAGATEIYRVGGAQAIAAMAYGTKTIRRVQKIFGPGNAYVVTAKRLLVGHVAIDLLPGPSELLVLADETANPKFAAADLLAQAEHGSGHERVWLVTTSAKILKAVEKEIAKQLPKLARREFIQRVLDDNAWLIQVKSLDDARGAGEPARAGALRSDDAQSAQGFRRHSDGGRDFPRAVVADGAGRLRGRAEPHAADRRRGRVVCRPDRGPVPAPHQRGGIQPRLAQESAARREKIRGTGRLGRAWEKRGNQEINPRSTRLVRHCKTCVLKITRMTCSNGWKTRIMPPNISRRCWRKKTARRS